MVNSKLSFFLQQQNLHSWGDVLRQGVPLPAETDLFSQGLSDLSDEDDEVFTSDTRSGHNTLPTGKIRGSRASGLSLELDDAAKEKRKVLARQHTINMDEVFTHKEPGDGREETGAGDTCVMEMDFVGVKEAWDDAFSGRDNTNAKSFSRGNSSLNDNGSSSRIGRHHVTASTKKDNKGSTQTKAKSSDSKKIERLLAAEKKASDKETERREARRKNVTDNNPGDGTHAKYENLAKNTLKNRQKESGEKINNIKSRTDKRHKGTKKSEQDKSTLKKKSKLGKSATEDEGEKEKKKGKKKKRKMWFDSLSSEEDEVDEATARERRKNKERQKATLHEALGLDLDLSFDYRDGVVSRDGSLSWALSQDPNASTRRQKRLGNHMMQEVTSEMLRGKKPPKAHEFSQGDDADASLVKIYMRDLDRAQKLLGTRFSEGVGQKWAEAYWKKRHDIVKKCQTARTGDFRSWDRNTWCEACAMAAYYPSDQSEEDDIIEARPEESKINQSKNATRFNLKSECKSENHKNYLSKPTANRAV